MKIASLFRMALLLVLFLQVNLIPQQVKLSFISVNYYGNNLYIDNVTAGVQYNNDVAVGSITNIAPDTSYALGGASFILTPKASVLNVGKNPAGNFTVTMNIPELSYSNTQTVSSVAPGAAVEVTFGVILVTTGNPMNITVTTNLTGDENPLNNVLNQYSLVLAGIRRTILLEEWTSSTCAPCAANNPTIDAFVTARFDSIVAIKHHVWWPSPGNDPMYLYNTAQNTDRVNYYGVGGVPHVIMDGVVTPSYPYSNPPSLPDAFYPRKEVATPVSITVTDTRIAGDSIRANISVNVISPVKFGDYRLRVSAVERKIHYTSAPGSNGETDFYDVFRRMYPSTAGQSLNLTPGTHNFVFTYKIDNAVWVDSMIYTAVYIQDDITKEVLNSAKARHYAERFIAGTPLEFSSDKFSCLSGENINFRPQEILGPSERMAGFNFEFFETAFPPAGWRLVNPDNGITFKKFVGANGPSFGGNSAVQVDFYSYSSAGRKDSLFTKSYTGLAQTDTVKFDWAYAQYPGYSDSLVVKLSTDGGITWPYEIFRKGGASLATAPATSSAFVPTSSQWLTFSYPLTNVNVPVELSSFTASCLNGNVTLNWSTATEINNLGFEIERSDDGTNFVKKGFVKGSGSSTEVHNYSYSEKPEFGGNKILYYRLRQVDFDGSFEYSPVVEVVVSVPYRFAVNQNYPNPFNPSTRINYEIPEQSHVTLRIFNTLGEEVAVLVNQVQEAGIYNADWNAGNLSSGLYICRLESGSNISVLKMLLMK